MITIEQQRNKHRETSFVSYIQPLSDTELLKRKRKAVKRKELISYKDKSINRYKLGPLDKLSKYDNKITKGLLNLNSIINFGLYTGTPISEIYIKDLKYLKFIADKLPHKFNDNLLSILK